MSNALISQAWKLDLEPMAKLLLVRLADAANDAGECWPSISTLADETGMSRSTVCAWLKRLEENGIITRSTGRTSTTYTLTLASPPHGLQQSATRTSPPDALVRHTDYTSPPPGLEVVRHTDYTSPPPGHKPKENPKENPKGTGVPEPCFDHPIEFPNWFPPTIERAVSACNFPVDPEFVAEVWNQAVGRDFTDGAGVEIRRFTHHVAARWSREKLRWAQDRQPKTTNGHSTTHPAATRTGKANAPGRYTGKFG